MAFYEVLGTEILWKGVILLLLFYYYYYFYYFQIVPLQIVTFIYRDSGTLQSMNFV